MAELNTAEPKGKKGGKVRSKKQDPHVDLTAMVDLAFLLITFFMLTASLTKPQSMNLAMPEKAEKGDEAKVADNRTVTILLGTDNQLVWYLGQFEEPFDGPEVQTYGKDGIRNVLLEEKQRVLATTQDATKGLIVIIKPCDESNYRNLVDILDEMVITGVSQYAIVDISPAELGLLQEKGLYPEGFIEGLDETDGLD
jgi:biopolymer transport protein ExbD